MFHIKNKIKRFFTARLTAKQQEIILVPKSAPTLCIQYDDGATQPFEGNQRQVERDRE